MIKLPSPPPPTHLMSSYSPSGGMKEIACSVSNLLSLTHWWNWQSSMAMELLVLLDSSPDLPEFERERERERPSPLSPYPSCTRIPPPPYL